MPSIRLQEVESYRCIVEVKFPMEPTDLPRRPYRSQGCGAVCEEVREEDHLTTTSDQVLQTENRSVA